jgi:TatD DNase family protein
LIVDTHAHLDDAEFDEDRDQVIQRAAERGMEAIIAVGSDLESSGAALSLADRYPWVYAAVGFHPHEATRLTPQALEELANLARHPKVVAIGEIGLDFYRNLSPPQAQQEAFAAQLELAARLGLPVIVHSRQAHGQTRDSLRAWVEDSGHNGGLLGVMHCFSGGALLGLELMEMGFLISFAGPLTFPKAHRTREVARALPLEGLVVETDCPYLTPAAHYGSRNEPAFVWAVAQCLAKVKGITLEEAASITTSNARRLFRFSQERENLLEEPIYLRANKRRPT